MADQAFLTHTFKSNIGSYAGTDTRVNRHMPERLNDIVNVRDWGATGNGSTDDTAAIQAAIDYAWNLATIANRPHGSIVFFPAGTYRIDSAPLNVHNATNFGGGTYGLSLLGVGMDVSILRGDYAAGFLVQRLVAGGAGAYGAGYMKDLTIWNESQVTGSGAFIAEAIGAIEYIDHVHFKGVNGFQWLHDVYAVSVTNCKFTSSVTANGANSATVWPPRESVGIWAPGGEITNCSFEGYDAAIGLVGAGGSVTANKITRCNIGIHTGRNKILEPQNLQISATRAMSNRIDRCGVGMYVFNGVGFSATSNIITGTDGVQDAVAMTLSWSGGTATATVAGGHNLQVNEVQALAVTVTATAGTYTLTFGGNTTSSLAYNATAATVQTALRALASIGASGVTCTGGPFPWSIFIEFTGALAAASQSLITVTSSVTGGVPTITRARAGSTTANLVLVTNPANWTPDGSGTQIVSCARTSATQFTYTLPGTPGTFVSATWNYALNRGISIRDTTNSFYACNVLNVLVPTNNSFDFVGLTTATGNHFKNVCMSHHASYGWIEPHNQSSPGWTFIACNRPVNMTVFANLPGNAGTGEAVATEGMEYTITNGSPDSAAFGTTISAGGTNRYKVRYNATNWTRVG